MMQIITFNQIVGTHYWNAAPEEYEYIRNRHRHVFHIRCWFDVSHSDRELEINHQQDIIEREISLHFGNDYFGLGANFGGYSCEDIAKWCVDRFECSACEVLEDGFGGAYVRK